MKYKFHAKKMSNKKTCIQRLSKRLRQNKDSLTIEERKISYHYIKHHIRLPIVSHYHNINCMPKNQTLIT